MNLSTAHDNEVLLVNLDNEPIGRMDKFEAHEHPAKLHRASSVWLINKKGQVLLQKRSAKKIVGAGWWANAICGNLRPTEIYSDCARRRLREEVGLLDGDLDGELQPIYKFAYRAFCNEKYGEFEFDQVYVGGCNQKAILNENEVAEVAWVDFDDLVAQINLKTTIVSPEQTLLMGLSELKEKTCPCEINIDQKKSLLAPWTCMMLRDLRLIKALKAIKDQT